MSSSKTLGYYDALVADTGIEDITENELQRETLRLLRDDDARLSRLALCICAEDNIYHPGYYHPGSSEDLGLLGHFAKKSTHFRYFELFGSRIFDRCSKQSVTEFFEDIGRCNHITTMNFLCTDLTGIMYKLSPAVKNDKITNWLVAECDMGVKEAQFMFNSFQYMENLEQLSLSDNYYGEQGFGDNIVAGCIPSLAACTAMQTLILSSLELGTYSCSALMDIFPRMASLSYLSLDQNSICDDCVETLLLGLVGCKQLNEVSLSENRISDKGLALLIEQLPASVGDLDLAQNRVTLARRLPLWRFKVLDLFDNRLSTAGPGVIATTLANPECRLESLCLVKTNIGDKGVATLAESLRNNQSLTNMNSGRNNITEMGWNALLSALCDTSSFNATHSSNHTLQSLGDQSGLNICKTVPQNVRIMSKLNSGRDKSRVAAKKTLQAHRHLDMRPFLDRELDLLPHVIAWLERYAESRLDLKLSSVFEFVRAMPMKVINALADETGGKERKPGR